MDNSNTLNNLELKENTKDQNMEMYKKYIKKLEGTPYSLENEKIVFQTEKGISTVCNFLPIIDEQIIYNNYFKNETHYWLRGFLLDKKEELASIKITQKELETFNFVLNSNWKINAIISAGGGNKDKVREIAQIVSKDFIKTTNIFTNTGFLKFNDKLTYLYHDGNIRRNSRYIC